MSSDFCLTPYISPAPVFRRLKIERFVGRQWLRDEVDRFLYAHDRGYVVLEAEAGVGKTSFLSHLVRERGYIQLFVEQANGLDNVANGLRSLAAQIIRTWSLQHWFADDVLPGVAVRPDFLSRLLSVAARRRDLDRPEQPIILVVDGLDEAGTFPGQNVLGLPRTLPRGVYILVSCRPLPLDLAVDVPQTRVTLAADDPRNLADMRSYLEQVATTPTFARAILTSGYTPDYFVESLLMTCRGNWSYLFHIVDEHERAQEAQGEQAARLRLESLPNTLWAYYAQRLRRQRDEYQDQWEKTLLPLLCTLCAAWESVSLPMLCTLAGVAPVPDVARQVVANEWDAFLIVEPGQEPRYNIGDATLSDFLLGRIAGGSMSRADRAFSQEFAAAVHAAHNRITEYYLWAWGTIEWGLPELVGPALSSSSEANSNEVSNGDGESAKPADFYGLRHLVAHMKGAGRNADIHRLLQLEYTLEEATPHRSHPDTSAPPPLPGWRSWLNGLFGPSQTSQAQPQAHQTRVWVWHMVRERQGELDDFLSDVAQAWRASEGTGNGAGTGRTSCHPVAVASPAIGLQCRYALINASIKSLANEIPAPLLVALLEHEIWLPAQLLAYVRQIPYEEQQVVALASLAPHLPPATMGDALAVVQTIVEEWSRADALSGLAGSLPPPLLRDALATAHAIEHPAWRTAALVGVARHMPADEREPLLLEALDTIKAIWNAKLRVEVLIKLAPLLPEPLLQRAVAIARTILDEDWRAQALIGLAPFLPRSLLREALALWEVWDDYWRAKVLAELAHRLGELGDIDHALNIARSIGNEHHRVLALVGLAPLLDGAKLYNVVGLVEQLKTPTEQATALAGLAPHLPPMLLTPTLATARCIEPAAERVRALIGMVPYVTPDERVEILRDLKADVGTIEQEQARMAAAASLAEMLAARGYEEDALTMAGQVVGKGEHTILLAKLAHHIRNMSLPDILERVAVLEDAAQRRQALALLAPLLSVPLLWRALDIARAIGDGNERGRTLANMFPYLPPPRLREVFQTVVTIGNEKGRAHALVELAEHLPEPMLRESLEQVRTMERGDCRRMVLVGLAPVLPESLLRTALEIAWLIGSEGERASVLLGLAPVLPTSALRESLDMALAIGQEQERARALVGLTPRLPETQLQRVLAASRSFRQPDSRSMVLMGLAPHLARHGYWRQALDAAWGIHKTEDRATTLVNLAPYLPQVMLKDVLAAVRMLSQPDKKAQALARICTYLPDEEHPYVQSEILKAAFAARWQGEATPSCILALLDDPHANSKVLNSVQMLESPDDRAAALADVAAHLSEPRRSEALRSALAATRMIWGPYRAEALEHLAPLLSEPMLREVLADVQVLEQGSWRASAIKGVLSSSSLPPALKGEIIHEPLAVARAIWDAGERVRALVALIPHLPPDQQTALIAETLDQACAIDDMELRSESLAAIVPHLEKLPTDTLYGCWIKMLYALTTRTTRNRPDLLSDLRVVYPVILKIGGEQALNDTAQAILDVGRWLA